MRTRVAAVGIALTLVGTTIAVNAPASAVQVFSLICAKPDGGEEPVICSMARDAEGRLKQPADRCDCSFGGKRVLIHVCGPGDERSTPVEGPRRYDREAFQQFLREAGQDGSLEGDLMNGRPVCYDPLPRP